MLFNVKIARNISRGDTQCVAHIWKHVFFKKSTYIDEKLEVLASSCSFQNSNKMIFAVFSRKKVICIFITSL